MTVADLLARMGNAEFVEWQCLDLFDPFGEFRKDMRLACALGPIFQAMLNRYFKDAPTVTPSALLTDWEQVYDKAMAELKARLKKDPKAERAQRELTMKLMLKGMADAWAEQHKKRS